MTYQPPPSRGELKAYAAHLEEHNLLLTREVLRLRAKVNVAEHRWWHRLVGRKPSETLPEIPDEQAEGGE